MNNPAEITEDPSILRQRHHVVHMSSAHSSFDTRIFYKECCTLNRAGYKVSLIAPCAQDEVRDGIRVLAIAPSSRRCGRMVFGPLRAYARAKALDATLYHIHDPALLPVAWCLRLSGKSVICDIHEDVPRDLLARDYLPPWLLRILSRVVERIENVLCRRMSALVTATSTIARRFRKIHPLVEVVCNFPIRDELSPTSGRAWTGRDQAVAFIGSMGLERGLRVIVEALARLDPSLGVRLKLAGAIDPPQHRQAVQHLPGWQFVDELGYLNRRQVADLLGRVKAGLVVYEPVPNMVDALPIKMFEYMSAGVPVIASDFPLWRQIIGDSACGLLVDPHDPAAIARAIAQVLTQAPAAERMGRQGRAAVEARYNWEREELKLLALYDRVLSGSSKCTSGWLRLGKPFPSQD